MTIAQCLSNLSYNDGVLAGLFLYLCWEVDDSWHEFRECRWPVHRWLLTSYAFILILRFTHVVGNFHASAESGEFLLNLRHKGALSRTAVSMTWFLMVPLFTAW